MDLSKAKGKMGARGQETDGDDHIINRLRKIIDCRSEVTIKFLDKTQIVVNFIMAETVLKKYHSLDKPYQKEEMILLIWKSKETFLKYV